jgi:hypothetical protein
MGRGSKRTENLIERTKIGIQRAKAEGKHCGRPFKEIEEQIDVPYVTLIRRKRK